MPAKEKNVLDKSHNSSDLCQTSSLAKLKENNFSFDFLRLDIDENVLLPESRLV